MLNFATCYQTKTNEFSRDLKISHLELAFDLWIMGSSQIWLKKSGWRKQEYPSWIYQIPLVKCDMPVRNRAPPVGDNEDKW